MGAFCKVKQAAIFDWRTAGLLLLLNAGAVWIINFKQGMGDEAIGAALVQMGITTVSVGVFMPHIRKAASKKEGGDAFLYGGLFIPSCALGFSASVHWYLGTPNMLGTVIYLFVATVVASMAYVLIKRTAVHIPLVSVRRLVKKL